MESQLTPMTQYVVGQTLRNFAIPIKDDGDAGLLATLHEQNLLPEDLRRNFFEEVKDGIIAMADASFIVSPWLGRVFTDEEREELRDIIEVSVLPNLEDHISRVRSEWSSEVPPDEQFQELEEFIQAFVKEVTPRSDHGAVLLKARSAISVAVSIMADEYESSSSTSAPTSSSTPQSASLSSLFRDIDE